MASPVDAAAAAASLVESAKKAAAFKAVEDHLPRGASLVGIGSGSTVVYVVEAIVARGPAFSANMAFVPTGSQSRALIRAAGLRLCGLDERPLVGGVPAPLDVAFDGADEVDEELNLIKGGGGCLFQEKMVAVAARKFVVVADYRKRSQRLCTTWRIPIEVLPLAAPDVLARLRQMGSPNPVIRSGLPGKAGELVTDNGMWIIDAPFAPLRLAGDFQPVQQQQQQQQQQEEDDGAGDGTNGIWEVAKLGDALIKMPGVVETGLFYGVNGHHPMGLGRAQKPIVAYFGTPSGEVDFEAALT